MLRRTVIDTVIGPNNLGGTAIGTAFIPNCLFGRTRLGCLAMVAGNAKSESRRTYCTAASAGLLIGGKLLHHCFVQDD